MRFGRWLVSFFVFLLVSCSAVNSDHLPINYSIRVIELDKSVLVEKEIQGYSDDVLLDVLKSEFDVVSSDSEWGTFLVSINGSTTGPSLYLAIYVNGEMASVGINDIVPHEGDEFEFIVESFA